MGLIVFLFGFFILIGLLMVERWLPLLAAIFTGNSQSLEEDILYSGICEKKQKDWDTKYKRRAEEMKRERELKSRQESVLRSFWGLEDEPIYHRPISHRPISQQPQQPRVYVKPVRREPVDPEMQRLMQDLYDEC